MSEHLSLGEPNEGVTLHPISKGERLELSFTKCHHKVVDIGLEDASLSIEIPVAVRYSSILVNLRVLFVKLK